MLSKQNYQLYNRGSSDKTKRTSKCIAKISNKITYRIHNQ